MMTKIDILNYLKNRKDEFYNKYGITTLGIYENYARDEATSSNDVDIFYERDSSIELQSGLEFLNIGEKIAKDLKAALIRMINIINPPKEFLKEFLNTAYYKHIYYLFY